jgi:hypothetical protein
MVKLKRTAALIRHVGVSARHCSADRLLRRMNSRLMGVPPIVGLHRRDLVHAGGRSAHGSKGAISIASTPPPL